MVKKTTFVATLLLTACTTAEKSSENAAKNATELDAETLEQKPKSLAPSFYTLKEGAKIKNIAPLPNKTEIIVNWTYSDGGKKTQEGFRGWDFDHDGRFDMLEVLDQKGKPSVWAYDFDGDGLIDTVQKIDAEKHEPVISAAIEPGTAKAKAVTSEESKSARNELDSVSDDASSH